MYNTIQKLLRSMVLGKSTASEEKEIRQWFLEPDTQQLSDAEAQLKEEIWQQISTQLTGTGHAEPKVIPLYRRYTSYAAAACLLAMLSGSCYVFMYQQAALTSAIAVDNTASKNAREVFTGGLTVNVLPAGKATMETDFRAASSNIRFCGNMELTNNTGAPMDIEIGSSCAFSPYTSGKKELKEGVRYFVFHNRYKFDEVYVLNMQEIDNLPRPLKHKVKTIFNI